MILLTALAIARRRDFCSISPETFVKLDAAVLQFDLVSRLLAGDLDEAQNPDAEAGGNGFAERGLGSHGIDRLVGFIRLLLGRGPPPFCGVSLTFAFESHW